MSASNDISYNIDVMLDSISKIVARIGEIPEPGALAQRRGTSHGVASGFYRDLVVSSNTMERLAQSVRVDLEKTRDAIQGAIEDASRQDESIRMDVAILEEQVDGVGPVAPAVPAAPAPTTSAGSSLGGYK